MDRDRNKEKLLTTRQAGQIAKRHPRTIIAWINKNKLPAMKFEGGRGPYLIRRDDLDKTIAFLTTPKPYTPHSKETGEETGN